MHLQIHSRQPISEPHPTPLLFVHGGCHDAWYWTHFLDYFANHGYAAYAPDPAAAGILLVSVPSTGAGAFLLRLARKHPGAFLRGTIAFNPRLLYHSPRLLREILFSADCPDEIVNECYRHLQDESWLATLETVLLLPQPRRIQVPMLVLGAADDRSITEAEVEATARAYGTQAVIFPNMPHHMTLVAAWSAVADCILAWLRDHGL